MNAPLAAGKTFLHCSINANGKVEAVLTAPPAMFA
jgi:hypothetical protein